MYSYNFYISLCYSLFGVFSHHLFCSWEQEKNNGLKQEKKRPFQKKKQVSYQRPNGLKI